MSYAATRNVHLNLVTLKTNSKTKLEIYQLTYMDTCIDGQCRWYPNLQCSNIFSGNGWLNSWRFDWIKIWIFKYLDIPIDSALMVMIWNRSFDCIKENYLRINDTMQNTKHGLEVLTFWEYKKWFQYIVVEYIYVPSAVKSLGTCTCITIPICLKQ